MKKKILLFVILFAFTLVVNVEARTCSNNTGSCTYTPQEIRSRSYVIGKHLFTRAGSSVYSGTLTTQWIMLASTTISGESLNDRIIYYKDSDGIWWNAINDQEVQVTSDFTIEYENGIKILSSPTLFLDWNEETDPNGYNKYLINNEGLLYANVKIETFDQNVDGYEIYDSNDNLKASGPVTGPLSIVGNANQSVTLYAKTYKLYGENKIYSEKSNNLVLDFNMVMPAPTLVQVENDVLYHYNEETGMIETDVKITLPEGALVDGYDVFKVSGVVVDSSVASSNDPNANAVLSNELGQSGTYYAKAYRGSGDNKVYGPKSEDIQLTFRNAAPTKPVLVQDYQTDYSKYFVQDGKLATKLKITLPENAIADGFDIYENDERVNAEDIGVDGIVTVTSDPGVERTFCAKTYVKYGSADNSIKDYSEEDCLTLDFEMVMGEPTLVKVSDVRYENGQMAIDVNVTLEDGLTVDGYEIYEQLDPLGTPIEGNFGTQTTLYDQLGSTKTIYARTFVQVGNQRVYSDFTSPLQLTFRGEIPTTPNLVQWWDQSTDQEGYTKYYVENGVLSTKVRIELPDSYVGTGYDIFDENDQVVNDPDVDVDVMGFITLAGENDTPARYYAKTYIKYGNATDYIKDYSEKSNVLLLDFDKKVPKPTLINSDEEFYYLDGQMAIDAHITFPAGARPEYADGYDVFMVSGLVVDSVVATGLPTADVVLKGDLGSTKTFYAKAYVMVGDDKIYGDKSSDLTLTFRNAAPTVPTLVHVYDENDTEGYSKYYVIDGKIKAKVKLALPDEYIADGYDIFDQNNEIINTSELGVDDVTYVTGSYDITSEYYAKTYKKYGTLKDYSDEAAELSLDFDLVMPTPTLLQSNEDDDAFYFDEEKGMLATKAYITVPNNAVIENISGYEVYEQLVPNADPVVGTYGENVTLYGNVADTKTFYAVTYTVIDGVKVYSENSTALSLTFRNFIPTKPELVLSWNENDDPDGYTKYFVENGKLSAYVKANIPESGFAHGYDVFDENDVSVNTIDVDTEGTVLISGLANTPKTYYAKTYIKYGTGANAVKDYSEASSTLTLDFNKKMPTPTLVKVDDEFRFDNGLMAIDVKINELPSASEVDGYDVFEGNDVVATGTRTGSVTLKANLGATKTYYAKTYVMVGEDKLYSTESEDLTLTFRNGVPTKPTLLLGWNEEDDPEGYTKYSVYNNQLATLVYIELPENAIADGYDIFDANNQIVNQEELIPSALAVVIGEPEQLATYYAKTYKKYGTGANALKDYSEESTPLTLDFHLVVPKPTLVQDEVQGDLYFYDETKNMLGTDVHITFPNDVNTSNITGYDIFESLAPNAEPITGIINESTTVYGELKDTKMFYARAYVQVGTHKIYSDLSTGLELTFRNAAPTPVSRFEQSVDLIREEDPTYDPEGYSKYFAQDGKVATNVYAILPETYNADGYDVFKVVNDGDDILVVENNVIGGNSPVIEENLNTTATYYAKTYKKYGTTNPIKDYSEASEMLELNFQLKLPKPTLVQVDDEFVYANGQMSTEVTMELPDEAEFAMLNGYDIFESLAPNATPIEGDTPTTVYGNLGETKIFYARTYVELGDEKIYSDFSTGLELTFRNVVPTQPELVLSWDSEFDPNGYTKYFVDGDKIVANLYADLPNNANADGYDVFKVVTDGDDILVAENVRVGNAARVMELPDTNASYYAKAYVKYGSGNDVAKDYSTKSNNVDLDFHKILPTPQLAQHNDGENLFYYDATREMMATNLEMSLDNDMFTDYIDGYDVFENLNGNPIASGAYSDLLTVYAPINATKTYYAKTYVTYISGVDENDQEIISKIYSSESQPLTLTFTASVPEAPTLALDWNNVDDPNGYTKYYVNEGKLYTDVSLVLPQNSNDNDADGYDVFEGDTLLASAQSFDEHLAIEGTYETSKTIYAKAYKKYGNAKIYSAASNELTLDYVLIVPTPEFVHDWNNVDDPNGYNKFYYDDRERKMAADVSINYSSSVVHGNIDGYIVYGSNGSTKPTPVVTATALDQHVSVYGTIGEEMTYTAKAYVNIGEQKVLSSNSQPLVFDFKNNLPKLVLKVKDGREPLKPYVILNKEEFCTNDNCMVDSVEFFEYGKASLPGLGGDIYTPIELDYASSSNNGPLDNRVYDVPNVKKSITARAVVKYDRNNILYGDYAEAVKVDTEIPVPGLDIRNVDCSSGDTCTIYDVGSPILETTYFIKDEENPVYYYDYMDLFEEGVTEPVLVGIPTGATRELNGIEVLSTKNYYAKAYVMYNGEKVYSNPTETQTVTFNYEIATPTLSENGHPAPYVLFVGINADDYLISNEEPLTYKIDGFKLYEKNGDEYVEVDLPHETDANDMRDNRIFSEIDVVKTYYARAYKTFGNKTVYSEYSNPVVFELHVPKPTIATPDPVVCSGMTCSIDIGSPITTTNTYYLDNEDPDNNVYYYDKMDLFDDETDELVLADIPTGGVKALENVPRGSIKTYYAKAYVMNGTQKIYSQESEPVTITFRANVAPIDFKTATKIDVTNATSSDNPGITANINKYDVTKDGNTITVTDRRIIPYIGGNIPTAKKWVGILVDLGVKVQGTTYTIEAVDYADAQRWGATNDTTFIMWLTTEQGGTFTFTNVDEPTDTINITVTFEEDFPVANLANVSVINAENAVSGDNPGIAINADKYTVSKDGTTITVYDNGIVPYVGGNIATPKKWVGILVDLGVKVVGTGNYGINNEDYADAQRWGATNDTTFIMWLTTEQGGTFSFANVDDANDTINVTVRFVNPISFESATKISGDNIAPTDNQGIANNIDKYTVTKDENTITIKNNGLTPYVGGNTSTPMKWVGILVDLGVKVRGSNYTIEDIDYSDAQRWGATNDTTFVMWLTTESAGNYTFTNVDNPNDSITITVVVDDIPAIRFKSATPISINGMTETDNPGIAQNAGKYTVAIGVNAFTITDNGLTAYVGGNSTEPKKWVGVLVDLGAKVQGVQYHIEPEDYADAQRWGATNDTTFVMWLSHETGTNRTIIFQNVENPNDSISLVVKFK